MVGRAIKEVGFRIKASLAGYSQCRGIFRVVDQRGRQLDDVAVSYKVGDSDWVACGHSYTESERVDNFFQPSTVFYPIGKPVMWRFYKPGYEERTVTRYTADKHFDLDLDTVMLIPANFYCISRLKRSA